MFRDRLACSLTRWWQDVREFVVVDVDVWALLNTLCGLYVGVSDISGDMCVFGFLQKVQSSMLSSDEMELYANVLRRFRTVFLRQEHMRTFRMYDLSEVSNSHSDI